MIKYLYWIPLVVLSFFWGQEQAARDCQANFEAIRAKADEQSELLAQQQKATIDEGLGFEDEAIDAFNMATGVDSFNECDDSSLRDVAKQILQQGPR